MQVAGSSKNPIDLEEIESPFTEEILQAPLPPKFNMPQFNRYDGSRDPVEHLEGYRTWMELHGATGSTLCKGFPLTLCGAARQWFRLLKSGSISSFVQLSRAFVTHFRAARSVKRPKSYLFTVKQGNDETLKDYIARFNEEALCIEGCNDDLMLSAMMSGLKPSKLLWSLGKNDPKDFQELMSRAQKYANAEVLMSSRRDELSKCRDK